MFLITVLSITSLYRIYDCLNGMPVVASAVLVGNVLCVGWIVMMGKPVSSLLPVELEIGEKPISHPCMFLNMDAIPHIPLSCCDRVLLRTEGIGCLRCSGLLLSVDCDRLLLLLLAGHSICSQCVAVIL